MRRRDHYDVLAFGSSLQFNLHTLSSSFFCVINGLLISKHVWIKHVFVMISSHSAHQLLKEVQEVTLDFFNKLIFINCSEGKTSNINIPSKRSWEFDPLAQRLRFFDELSHFEFRIDIFACIVITNVVSEFLS